MEKEQRLIEKARERDSQAISILYENNIRAIYRFVLYKTSHKELAEDITSEVFVRAFEKLEQFKGCSSFKTWLYTIAKNLVIEWYRNKDKTTELIYEPEGENFEDEIVKNENQKLKNETDESLLNQILDKFDNEKYKQVLELRFLLNYTVRETAEEMNISEGNVKVIQNRALKKAREIIINK